MGDVLLVIVITDFPRDELLGCIISDDTLLERLSPLDLHRGFCRFLSAVGGQGRLILEVGLILIRHIRFVYEAVGKMDIIIEVNGEILPACRLPDRIVTR